MLITGLASCKLFPSSCFGARKAQIHFVVKSAKVGIAGIMQAQRSALRLSQKCKNPQQTLCAPDGN